MIHVIDSLENKLFLLDVKFSFLNYFLSEAI
jgi:hypothetical protein